METASLAGTLSSFVMNEAYLLATVRYVELNSVRANLCDVPEDWRWSGAKAYLLGCDDSLVTVKPMLDLVDDRRTYLGANLAEEQLSIISRDAPAGRPVGDTSFVARMETLSGRNFLKQKSGPKVKHNK